MFRSKKRKGEKNADTNEDFADVIRQKSILQRHFFADIKKSEFQSLNPQYDGYQRGLASMVYKFFDTKASSLDRKTVGSGVSEKIKLANELHKPIIRKFNK